MDRQASIDLILDHYENPRHYGPMADPTVSWRGTTPGCGDVVILYLKLDEDERIVGISFEGEGCTISQAAASILTGMVIDRPLNEVMVMDHTALVEAMGEEIVRQRVTCATLPLDVLKAAGAHYRESKNDARSG